MRLAKAGLDVKVIERLPRVGGRTSTLASQGFRFDVGPTFFLYPHILAQIFSATGYNLYDEIELIRLDPQYRLVFGGGGDLWATPHVKRMEAAIARLSPQDAAGLQRFMADNRLKLERFKPILESAILSWRDVLTPHMLDHFTQYVGSSPDASPAILCSIAQMQTGEGVWYPARPLYLRTTAVRRALQQREPGRGSVNTACLTTLHPDEGTAHRPSTRHAEHRAQAMAATCPHQTPGASDSRLLEIDAAVRHRDGGGKSIDLGMGGIHCPSLLLRRYP
jgi:hypothetical protein